MARALLLAAEMARLIEVRDAARLGDYELHVQLAPILESLRLEAARLARHLHGRTVWMINSTAEGGGVAEMLPKQVAILRELGVRTEWAVITCERPAFFDLTKRLHNMMHGAPVGRPLGATERRLYEAVGRENADRLAERIGPDDIVVAHDPQPLVTGTVLKQRLGVRTIWRCHIGLAERTPLTGAAWRFIAPFVDTYDHAVFTAPDYVPGFIAHRATIIRPAIDPLSDKNRELRTHRIASILCNAQLAVAHTPVVSDAFRAPAERLMPDGSWRPATAGGDIGLLTRPIITQVSRWDRLKGFEPLLHAFAVLKQTQAATGHGVHQRRRKLARLVLAGPDPRSVADDPEGQEVLDALGARYRCLPPAIQQDVALLALPMASVTENALMVNAIQRCSTLAVQNSIREGFGLTATEAMWKAVPIVVSGAHGLRQQVRDGIEGRVVDDPHDTETLARTMNELLADRSGREILARRGQLRVCKEFLVLCTVRAWLRTLVERAHEPSRPVASTCPLAS